MILQNHLKLRAVLGGIRTYIPGYSPLGSKLGGNSHARYCYSVWLRHLIGLRNAGMKGAIGTVAELGPGDSLGTGIAALLSGADRYYGLDIFSFSKTPGDHVRLIAELLREQADVPNEDEFPELKPALDSYRFPRHLFDNDALASSLHPDRVHKIARAVENPGIQQGEILVQYYVPWQDDSVIQRGSVDVVFSQAVMEHVEDIDIAYSALAHWLRPSGFISHQIDLRCHGLSNHWNGHWSYSDWMLRIAKGRRPFLLNRQPVSAHLGAAERANFEILRRSTIRQQHGIRRGDLAPQFRGISEEDLLTSSLFLVARRT
jgi:hypothetical protein